MSNNINVAFLQDIYLIRSFFFFCFEKREISFEVSSFGGSLLLLFFGGGGGGVANLGFANTCDILLLLSGVRYFRNFTVSR